MKPKRNAVSCGELVAPVLKRDPRLPDLRGMMLGKAKPSRKRIWLHGGPLDGKTMLIRRDKHVRLGVRVDIDAKNYWSCSYMEEVNGKDWIADPHSWRMISVVP